MAKHVYRIVRMEEGAQPRPVHDPYTDYEKACKIARAMTHANKDRPVAFTVAIL